MSDMDQEQMWDALHQSIENNLGLKPELAQFLYDHFRELRMMYHRAIDERDKLIVKDAATAQFELSNYHPVEVKTIGQMIDELIIANEKIFHLIEKAEAGEGDVQEEIQIQNAIRRDLVRALDRRFGERDIGGRV